MFTKNVKIGLAMLMCMTLVGVCGAFLLPDPATLTNALELVGIIAGAMVLGVLITFTS